MNNMILTTAMLILMGSLLKFQTDLNTILMANFS